MSTIMSLPPSPTIALRPSPRYTIEVGNNTLILDPTEILDTCWTDGLETPCSICSQQFNIAIAPPVRTLRLHQSSLPCSPTTTDLPPIKITNTHLHCLKAHKIKFTPVSHAWHEPVARAYTSRESNIEAASMVFEIPIRILIAATQLFGQNVQIWHDYISIPQWQESFRGTTILPQIFQIFKYGGTALIHLDDEPIFDLFEVLRPEDVVAHAKDLKRLFGARWFRRMWIIVEFLMCRDGYVMNSRFEIIANTFSSLMRRIAEYHTMALSLSTSIDSTLDWMTSIPMFSKDTSVHNCFGHVYDLLANQGCRSHRDRFIATCAILEQDDYSNSLAELPQGTREACLWISKRALERNDYSPLLLRPPNEPQHPKVRWLRGHTSMDANMWGLGVQTSAAHTPPSILCDDTVDLEVQFFDLLIQTTAILDKDNIVPAQCPNCRIIVSCQANVWQAPNGQAGLCRVPGLLYEHYGSAPVGMIVEDGRVIGRAYFFQPGCSCDGLVRIRIN